MFYPLHELLSSSEHFSKLPSKKEEKWRFSKLFRYLDKTYQRTIDHEKQESSRNEKNFLEIKNGKLVSQNIPSSVHIKEHSLDCEVQNNPFSKLASCSSAYPLEINLFEEVELNIYFDYASQCFMTSNLNIILQEGVKASIYISFEGANESFISHSSHIKLENKAHLLLTQVQNLSSKAVLISQDCFHLHENSHLENFCLLYQAEYLHHFIKADLHYKSHLNINSLLLSKNEENFIFSCDINHRSDKSTSQVLSKQVLKDRSTCVFDANTKIFKGTVLNDVKQGSHALLLSESAQIHSKPHLEIYSDDLSASHGSTVGSLDQEAISYLMARGISDKKAHSILVNAFISEELESISSPEHKERISKYLGELDE